MFIEKHFLAPLAFAVALLLTPQSALSEAELPPMTGTGSPRINSVLPNDEQVGRFEKFELTIDLAASYDNPFDPDQVDLQAEFVAPSGRKVCVPGFFYQAYRHRNAADDAQRPLLDADGLPSWKVRFTPLEVGSYQYSLRLQNRFGPVREDLRWGPARFECRTSASRGFLRVSPANHRYFQFDDGTPFFAIGQNLQNDWPYRVHYPPLAASACNAVRIWTFCHWTWLEWTFDPQIRWAQSGDWMRAYAGAGKYNQRIAWIADQILDRCARDGLYLMLCMGNGTGGGELSQKEGYGTWGGHPYNKAHAGFLDDPQQLWTDPRARNLYKQRLRYIVARYSYSPGIWAWEFWNELGEAQPAMVDWHREMGDYLRALDPNQHLITTSTWQSSDKFRPIWDLPQIDFTQTHIYEPAAAVRDGVQQVLHAHPNKPHIVGEGGGRPAQREKQGTTTVATVDPEHIEFHNSLWAAAMSGAAGTTLPWWWRDRIEPDNLFSHYTAVARFVQGEPWATFQPLPPDRRHIAVSADPAAQRFSPVLIVPLGAHWGSQAPRNRFVVEPDGTLSHLADLRPTLFGHRRADWANPPVLEVDYPQAGQFIVHVSSASGGTLQIVLDGNPLPPEKLAPDKNHDVNKDFTIDVPAGRHAIELRNAGPDWLRIGHLRLTNYRDTARYPDLDLYALQSPQAAYLWAHHRLNVLPLRAAGVQPQPIRNARAEIAGLDEGPYHIQWWDTYRGQVTASAERACQGGKLLIEIPLLSTDAGCKIKQKNR